MIKLSPAELLSICNAANLGINKYPDYFKETKVVVDEITKFVIKPVWDSMTDKILFIDELPF